MAPQELARASVVGIASLGRPAKISTSIAILPTPGAPPRTSECLGVLAGGYIFSCTHIRDQYATNPLEPDCFEAWCLNDPQLGVGIFAALYASSLDYLVLAPDTFMMGMSEAGGTESGLALHADFQDKCGEEIQPARLEFPQDCGGTKFWGYYFAADGRTTYRTKFRVRPGSHIIDFYSTGLGSESGVGGGPIFTDDHHLIGIITVATTGPDLNGLPHCLGLRLDLGLPETVSRTIPWTTVTLRAETPDEKLDPEDPWNRNEAEVSKALRHLK